MPKPTNKQELQNEAQKEYAALGDIRSQSDASHRHMLEAIGLLAEDELFTPGRHTWTGVSTLAADINSCGGAHYRWAQTGIRSGTRAWSGERATARRKTLRPRLWRSA
jgi:hypothetical protein